MLVNPYVPLFLILTGKLPALMRFVNPKFWQKTANSLIGKSRRAPGTLLASNQKPRKSPNTTGVWEFQEVARGPGSRVSYPQVINSLWISMEFGSLPNSLVV